jgi:hypothetical protein
MGAGGGGGGGAFGGGDVRVVGGVGCGFGLGVEGRPRVEAIWGDGVL